MSDFTLLEHYVALSLQETLRDAAITELLQVQGFRDAAEEEAEEWLALDLVASRRIRSRRGVWRGSFVFQVACHARMATQRVDKDANVPWRLAGQVRALFSQVDLEIKQYGESGEATVAWLQIAEPEQTYGTDEIATHWVLLVFVGTINQE